MQVNVQWTGDENFVATTQHGHKVEMSAEAKQAPTPMELVLAAVAGCSSVDVVSILKKSRCEVSHCGVEVEAQRAEQIPRVFTHICLNYRVCGKNITRRAAERAVSLSMEKYCSVSHMLAGRVTITYRVEIEED
ncbi:MAG: hypothetical protein D6694_14515 [Gammaproteobacteria bacterium]|nr:MAG: hypothetical protein D6694_14515 [Gammaproteobacteria bacterium]